jgi:hypothetical protein
MKQHFYLGMLVATALYLPTLPSEYYRQNVITGLMARPQLRIITLEKNCGYILDRSQIRTIIDTSQESQGNKVETYMAVFDREGMVSYSYFHEGPNAGQLLVYLEDPTKWPLKGQDADFNYLRKRYLESKTYQK